MSNSGCLVFNQVCLAQVSGWCQARSSVLHSLVHPIVQTFTVLSLFALLRTSQSLHGLLVSIGKAVKGRHILGPVGPGWSGCVHWWGPPTVTGSCGCVCFLLRHGLLPMSSFSGQPRPFCGFPSTFEPCLCLQTLVQWLGSSPTEE